MKQLLTLFFLCSLVLPAFARMNDWFMHEVTRTVRTPSLPWLEKNSKPIRVLYISSGAKARDIVEIAQRMNIDFTVFTGKPEGADDHWSASVLNTSPAEAYTRLRKCLEGKYDVVVVEPSLDSFPADLRNHLLGRVRDGEFGLVYTGTEWVFRRYKKMLANPLPTAGFRHQYSDPVPEVSEKLKDEELRKAREQRNIDNAAVAKSTMECFAFGKGRIVMVKPFRFRDLEASNDARFEASMAMHMQAILFAANGEAPLSFTAPDLENNPVLPAGAKSIPFFLSGPKFDSVRGEVRIRNEFNEIEATLPLNRENGFRLSVPQMASGKYFADVRFFEGNEVVAHGVYRFEQASPLGNVSIACGDTFEKKQFPKGSVRIPAPFPEPLTLRLRVKDLPHGNVWAIKEIPVEPNARNVSFEFGNCVNPTLAAMFLAELVNAKGEILSRTTKKIYFPNREPGDYLIFSWGGPPNLREARVMEETFGFSATLHADQTEYNFRPMPGAGHISIGTNRNNKNTTDIAWGGGPKYEDNIYNPEVLKKVQEELTDLMKKTPWRKRSAMVFNLGDENGVSMGAGYGPNDLLYFRNMLRGKYLTIDKLNKEWQTAYKSFDEVPNDPHLESLAKGRYAAWNDHCEYMERSYADWHTARANVIRKFIPDTLVGAEGSQPADLERTIEHLQFWGPYGDGEEMLAFGGNRLRTSWYGYVREHIREQAGGYPFVIASLLKGVINGMGWFSCEGPAGSETLLAADLRPAWGPRFVDALNQMRFGFGQILAVNPFKKSGVAFFSSHLSGRASSISKACVHPTDSWSVLLNHFYKTGRSVTMVSERTLPRLNNKDVKVLFLCGASAISEQAAKRITEFVKNGGTVVADANPGMFNEYMRPLESNAMPDLFGKDLVFSKASAPVLQPVALSGSFLGKPYAMKAKYVKVIPGAPLFQVRDFGKGRAVLLNFSLKAAETSSEKDASVHAFLDSVLTAAGEPAPFKIDLPLDNYIVRVRSGRGFDLAGIHGFDYAVHNSVRGRILLPEKKFVYKCKSGFAGHTDTVPLAFNAGDKHPLDCFPLQMFSFFDEEQKVPDVSTPDSLRRGDGMLLDFAKVPKGRILLLRVFKPDGTEILRRNRVLNTEKISSFDFRFAFDDPAGKWNFILSDIATGLERKFSVDLR